jgi:hypothetical protein
MPASDILKGLLAFGTGGLTGYAGAKEKNRERDFKQQIKDMELQVRMENYARLHAEAEARNAVAQQNANTNRDYKGEMSRIAGEMLDPKIEKLEAETKFLGGRFDDIKTDNSRLGRLADSLIDDRKLDRDELRQWRLRMFGAEGGTTPYGPTGAKLDPATGKVASGSSTSAAAKTPYHVKLEIKELSEAREPWLRAYGKTLEDHPEIYEQVIEAAASYAADDPDNKNKNMKMAQLKRSKYYEQAIEDAKEAIAAAKSTEVAAPPPLRPDFMRFQQMLTGPQAP